MALFHLDVLQIIIVPLHVHVSLCLLMNNNDGKAISDRTPIGLFDPSSCKPMSPALLIQRVINSEDYKIHPGRPEWPKNPSHHLTI